MLAASPPVGLAQVLRRHGPAYLANHPLSVAKAKVWRAILAFGRAHADEATATAYFGGHGTIIFSREATA